MLWSLIRKLAGKESLRAAAVDYHLPNGIKNLREGDFTAAYRHLRTALAADSANVDVWYYLALAEAHSGRLKEAETLLKATRAQRDDADVNNALGNVGRLAGRLEEAAEH